MYKTRRGPGPINNTQQTATATTTLATHTKKATAVSNRFCFARELGGGGGRVTWEEGGSSTGSEPKRTNKSVCVCVHARFSLRGQVWHRSFLHVLSTFNPEQSDVEVVRTRLVNLSKHVLFGLN